jgi:hypothetical protein
MGLALSTFYPTVFRQMHLLCLGRFKLAEGARPQLGPTLKPKATELLNSAFSLLAGYGFVVFSPLSERHGSWEIVYSRETENIHRKVSIALTNELPSGIDYSKQPWRVEVWIGAEFEKHFFRRMVGQFTATSQELNSPSFLIQMGQILEQSIHLVLSREIRDLIDVYEEGKFKFGDRRVDASDEKLFKKPTEE